MNEKAIYEIVLKNQKFNDGLKDTEKRLDHFEGSLTDIQNTITAAFGVGALLAFGNEAYKTSTQLQSLRSSIVFAAGSSKEGAKDLEFLADISKRMGLDLLATTEGFRTFSAALIGSKFEGDKSREIFEKISKAVTVMGLSSDDAKGAFLALGQMVSKGTVSAEELRGQLGERLPGAFQIAARSLHVTTAQLGKMLQAGEVLTEDFLPKFADEIDKTFGKGLAKAVENQAADVNKLKNTWLEFKDFFGTVIGGVIHLAVADEKSLTNQFFTQRDEVNRLEKDVKPLADRYQELTEKATLTSKESEELKNVTNALAEAMPSAVTQWDAYGNAIRISNFALDQSITKNKEALKILNANAIGEKTDELMSAAREAMALQQFLNDEGTNPNIDDNFKNMARERLKGFTGKGGIIEMLQAQIDDLKGGGRDTELMQGIKERDKMFAGLTPGSASSSTGSKGKKSGSTGGGVEKISSATRNITVNITKLVETVNISKTFGRNSDSELVDAVKRALLTGVNDVNIMAQ